jgi:hypothetical protein
MENEKVEKKEFKYNVEENWFGFSNVIQIIFGVLCIWWGLHKSSADIIYMRVFEITKLEEPVTFWLSICFFLGTGLLVILLGLWPALNWAYEKLYNK